MSTTLASTSDKMSDTCPSFYESRQTNFCLVLFRRSSRPRLSDGLEKFGEMYCQPGSGHPKGGKTSLKPSDNQSSRSWNLIGSRPSEDIFDS